MTAAELAIAALVIAVGAAIQGGVGFGMNLLVAPVLALLDPDLVPGPAIAAAMTLTILVAYRDRASLDRRGVVYALIGRLPGTLAGALLVAALPARGVTVAVGVAVLVGVVLNLRQPRLRPTPPTLMVAGVVSGFSGTLSSIGGPPMAIVYANEPGPVIRASLSFIFTVGGLISLATLAAVGDFGGAEATASAVLLFPGAIGFLASRRLTAHVDAGRTRLAVLSVSAIGAVSVLVTELL